MHNFLIFAFLKETLRHLLPGIDVFVIVDVIQRQLQIMINRQLLRLTELILAQNNPLNIILIGIVTTHATEVHLLLGLR